jgi:general secretion pathway protein D
MKQSTSLLSLRRSRLVLGILVGCLISWVAAAQPGPTISLVLQDTPLGVALKLVAEQAGKKLQTYTPLDELVNVNLQDATLDTAVTTLLDRKPYMWALDNDVVHIFKSKHSTIPSASVPVPEPAVTAIPETPPVTRILALKKRKAEGILELVAKLSAKDVKIVADLPTNSLVMVGPEQQIAAVASLALEMDETPVAFAVTPPEEIITESFTLEYVTEFEDLEKSLSLILYGERLPDSGNAAATAHHDFQNQLLSALPALSAPGQLSATTGPRKEYYMLDKIRRVLLITTIRSKMDMIRRYFQQVNTPVPQVLIEAHIMALEDGTDRNLGINWNMQERWGAIYSSPEQRQTTTTGGGTGTDQGTQIGGGFFFGRWDLSNVTSVLRAVQEQNRGQILSQPRLMTLSGKTATIDISTQYPYKSSVTLNQTGTTQNVQFVNVGITLNVVPQVNLNADTVVMQLDPNVSDLVSLSADGPITTQRRTSTNVEVKNGETVVIGGLLRDEDSKGNKSVPFLSRIPLLGDFFKFSQKRKKRTNLMILITPRIVADCHAATVMSAPVVASLPLPLSAPVLLTPPESAPVAIPPANSKPQKATNETSEYQKRLEALRSKYLHHE